MSAIQQALASYGSTFNPASVGTITAWYDASDSANIAFSGSNLLSWSDKSGNAYNMTLTGTPTSTTLGGRVAVLTGSGNFPVIPSGALTTAGGGNTLSAFVALKTGVAAQYVPVFDSPLRRLSLFIDNRATGAVSFSGIGGTSAGSSGGGPFANATTGVISLTADASATTKAFLNGDLTGATLSCGTAWADTIALGDNPSTGGTIPNATYGEFLLYDGFLSTLNRQKIEGYLAWKWGSQALLPGGHPYAGGPP